MEMCCILGTPYELTWADYNDQKGFHVFNPKTHKVKFVKNPNVLFTRIEYDDKDKSDLEVPTVKYQYVKIVVINKTNPYLFDKFITNIMSQSPVDLKITDIDHDFDDVDVDVEDLELEDTKTLITKFIDQVDSDLNKDKVKSMMIGLYLSALEVVD